MEAVEKKLTALYRAVSAIVHECHMAEWIPGCEYAIWDAMRGGSQDYGIKRIPPAMLARCMTLAHIHGGWVTWPDRDREPSFITAEEWNARRG
jgi:hypothetical protein